MKILLLSPLAVLYMNAFSQSVFQNLYIGSGGGQLIELSSGNLLT